MPKIAFDTKLKRPACVLLQAVMGGDCHVAHQFPVETWLVAPTPDMCLFEYTDEQLPKLVEIAKRSVFNSAK